MKAAAGQTDLNKIKEWLSYWHPLTLNSVTVHKLIENTRCDGKQSFSKFKKALYSRKWFQRASHWSNLSYAVIRAIEFFISFLSARVTWPGAPRIRIWSSPMPFYSQSRTFFQRERLGFCLVSKVRWRKSKPYSKSHSLSPKSFSLQLLTLDPVSG